MTRNYIFENMHDAVIAIDPERKVIDLNFAMQSVFGISRDVVGQPLSVVLGDQFKLFERFLDMPEAREDIVIESNKNQGLRYYELRMLPLMVDEHFAGRWFILHDIERRQIDEAIMNNLPDALYFKDKASRFTRLNWAQAQKLGIADPNEALGRTDFDFKPPDLAQIIFDEEQQLVETGQPVLNRIEFNPDGQDRWYSVSKVPIKDSEGRIIGLVGLSRDITDIKRVEKERDQLYSQTQTALVEAQAAAQRLSESETRYRLIAENVADVIAKSDAEGIRTFVTPSCYVLSGYTPEELVGKLVVEIIHPDDRPKSRSIMLQALNSTLSSFSLTQRIHHKVGHYVWVEVTSKIIRNPDNGKPIEIVSLIHDITERKAQERQLHFQASLQENVSDAVIVTDTEFRIQSWNRASERIYGWLSEEVIHSVTADILGTEFAPPKDLEHRILELQEKGWWQGEVVQHHKDGSIRHILGSVTLLKDENGVPFSIVSVNHDITERKETEKERDALYAQAQTALAEAESYAQRLIESESILRAIIDIAADAIISIDAEGHIIAFNPAAAHIFGYSVEEVIGQNIKLLMPTQTASEHDGYLQRRKSTHETKIIGVQREEFAQRKDGSTFPIHLAINEVNVNGHLMYTGLIRDVTDTKRIEKERNELYTQTQTALAATESYAQRLNLLTEMSQKVNMASSEIEMYGIAAEAITGILNHRQITIFLLLGGEESQVVFHRNFYGPPMVEVGVIRPISTSLASQAILAGRLMVVENETPANSPNINTLNLAQQQGVQTFVMVPMVVRQKSIGGIVIGRADSTTFDVHDENLLMHIGSFLGIAVENMHRNLELQEATASAEKANRTKSEFLATMSHELRTPLNGILGYVQILQKNKELAPKQREGLAVIRRSGDHLLTLINDILDFSKIEAERLEISTAAFDLVAMLINICEVIQVNAEQKGLKFGYEQLSELPSGVSGDETRLRQILLNLLGNAVKYTQRGGVIFKVGYHEDKIRFQIEDTGIGIAPDAIQLIFQPFKQLDTPGAHIEGTGLGLAISSQLVALMGSVLEVKSQIAEGSTFWFELNLPPVENFVGTTQVEQEVSGYHGETRRIMVVDDKPDNRAVFTNMLVPLGFEIREAVNGQDCLKETVDFKPHVILMDLRMPVMDGLEAMRRLRQMQHDPKPVLIAVSASAFEHDQEASFEAGADAFLPKPFRFEKLIDLLGQHLALEWIAEEPAVQPEPAVPESITPPPEADLNMLFDLAMRGDVRGIQLQANRLSQSGYKGFAAELESLAQSFRVKELRQFIKQHREGTDG
ncbi:MAG: PAS domain S-box protein [Chloroflexota bacterium]